MFMPENVQVYVAIGRVDMRKSIDGLSMVVSQQFLSIRLAGACSRSVDELPAAQKLLWMAR